MAYAINEDECISCGDCVDECPNGSISETLVAFKINPKTCTECDGEEPPKCVAVCETSGCITKVD